MVELLVVVAIISILAAVALPQFFGTTLPRMKLRSTTMEMYATLQNARSKAIGSTAQYGVEIDLGASPQTYRLMTRANGAAAWGADATMSAKQIDAQVTIDNVTVDAANYTGGVAPVIGFQSVGTASGSIIKLRGTTNTGDKYQIDISATTGRVKIQQGWS